jgi:hypothetical protein
MSSSVAGAWAKIERAKEQVQYLNHEVSNLLESGHYNVVGENHPERQKYNFSTGHRAAKSALIAGPCDRLRVS